jgi:RNA polymerase-binding transcription factor DksA
MAKNKNNSKVKKAKTPAKPAKKVSKPATKKSVKPAKKVSKVAPKKPAKKIVKVANKVAPKKVAKPVKKTAVKKLASKVVKPIAKKTAKTLIAKAKPKETIKTVLKSKPVTKNVLKPKKTAGKPIDAIAKKATSKKAGVAKAKKKGKKDEDDEEDIPEEETEEDEEDVKDDYEKPDDDDAAIIDGGLDEAGLVDLEGGGSADIDDDDDEIPEKRGRGRRKKNDGKSTGNSMEAYIRNRPLQIDINKPLIKKNRTAEPKPFVNTEDKRTRYSDKELAEFKELILSKLKEAQSDYDLLKQTLSNEDNHGTDDTSPTFKLLEDGSDVMSKEETAQLASRQEKYIVNLKNALVRIENKTYGICRVTGKLIPKERLRSVPHATLGIDAKLGQ